MTQVNRPAHAAAQYRQQGWATIRLKSCSKAPRQDHGGPSWKDRIDPPEAFHPSENVGVRLGSVSGDLVDFDLDCVEAVALAHRYLPPTLTFGRQSKPRSHWLYKCPGFGRSRKSQPAQIELRADGGQTMFPGSTHPTGELVEWHDARPVAVATPAELLAAYGKLGVASIVAKSYAYLEQGRGVHAACLALAGALWRDGWDEETATDVVCEALQWVSGTDPAHRRQAFASTWSDDREEKTGWPTVLELWGPTDGQALKRLSELVSPNPRLVASTVAGTAPLTDAGNAERFVGHYQKELAYVAETKQWMRWTGAVWEPIRGEEPVGEFVRVARGLQEQGQREGQPELLKWGIVCESASKISSGLKLARAHPGVARSVEQFDVDPWALHCPNGVVDLQTGQLRDPRPEDLNTLCAGVPFDPTMECPTFVRFMREIFQGDQELIRYVLRYFGWSLSGDSSEQVFALWYGSGANGKSTLMEIVRYVLGDYAQVMASNMLMEKRGNEDSRAASPDVARLKGVRLAMGSETKDGQRWNEPLLKQLTGNESIPARHLYGSIFEMTPTWSLVLAVNHLPRVQGTDTGTWRRIQVVPFRRIFQKHEQDRTLLDKLRAEGPGILALLVQACLEWQQRGLAPPDQVEAAAREYKRNQDVVGQFLEECAVLSEEKSEHCARVWQAFRQWAETGNEPVRHIGRNQFYQRLRERPGLFQCKQDGVRVFRGMSLRPGGGMI